MSSYEYHRHSLVGRNDTEYILASVKEQELQFERLTRELEEEHNTVANQLEKCRLETNVEKNQYSKNSPLEEQVEASDTESRRGSARNLLGRETPQHKGSSSQPHLYKHDVEGGAPRNKGLANHRISPVKMNRPHTCPVDALQQQTVFPSTDHVSHRQPVVHPRPHYANPTVHAREPETPPFPTYFSPPSAYPPSYSYKPQVHPAFSFSPVQTRGSTHGSFPFESDHISSHYSHGQLLPVSYYPHNMHQDVFAHYPMTYQYPYPTSYFGQVAPGHLGAYHHMPAPVSTSSHPPPIPPRKPVHRHSPHHTNHQHASIPSSNHYHEDHASYSIYQNYPDKTRKDTVEPYSLSRQLNYNNNANVVPEYLGRQRSMQHYESTPVGRAHRNVPSPSEKAEHRHRGHVQSVSPRIVDPTHYQHSMYADSARITLGENPEVNEVIQMLRHSSYQVVANAAAYIQHVTYGNDKMKAVIRSHGVLPLLVNLLHHHVIDVQRNACGALRNLVFGRNNDEAKITARNCGGVSSLAHVLRNTDDQEMKELITGVLWNLSSCEQIKKTIADSAMPTLASRVIIHYVSLLEPNRMTEYSSDPVQESGPGLTSSDLTIDPHWSTLFISATGCLRNISSAGAEVRRKMRYFDGLIEALLLVIENVIGKNDVNSKGVENCMCILRNLSYRLALEVEAAHIPVARGNIADNNSKDEECWKRHKKKDKKRDKDSEVLSNPSFSSEPQLPLVRGVELLWQTGVVRRYLALLAETSNVGTWEAAMGALQNLSAGQWTWSADIRTAVRKQKGLPMLVEFLCMDNERIVTVMCSTLRNMALDERNKQLIGKHAMKNFADLLPELEPNSMDKNQDISPLDELPPVLSMQKIVLYEAACGAMRELLTSNNENAISLFEIGAVPKLVEISRGSSYRYPHRVVKAAGRVLALMWDYKNLRAQLKQQGWTQFHFNLAGVPSIASAGSQVSPYSSPPLSPAEPSSSCRESHRGAAYSKVAMRSPSARSARSSSPPPLPYAPMTTKVSSVYHSPQPDSNYVVMIQKGDQQQLLSDSWV